MDPKDLIPGQVKNRRFKTVLITCGAVVFAAVMRVFTENAVTDEALFGLVGVFASAVTLQVHSTGREDVERAKRGV